MTNKEIPSILSADMEQNSKYLTNLKDFANKMPQSPGVYIMKNNSENIIYIGKAINLKNRVKSYFLKNKDTKTNFLVRKIKTIEYIITDTEYEALILENNLIKEHKPHYNIDLKDGKTFPVIKITKEEYPRIYRTRRIINDGSSYYGPFPGVQNLDRYLEIIEKLFPLRKCKGKLKKRNFPCLYYHINKCSAPCAEKISLKDYSDRVKKIKSLLSGKTKTLIKILERNMQDESKNLNYEIAADLRDKVLAIKDLEEEQKMMDFNEELRDYISFEIMDNYITFIVFKMRSGKMLGRDLFRTAIYTEEKEAVTNFILQYYKTNFEIPEKIIIPINYDFEIIQEYFENIFDKKVSIETGFDKRDLSILRLIKENCIEDLNKRIEIKNNASILKNLAEVLKIERIPYVIEGFDIAQLAGKYTVASMVSFKNGKPDKSNYRHFKIRSLDNQIDDYEAIREAVARRYTRLKNENLEYPDLILIDGGPGQLSSAKNVLKTLNIKIPIASLAKRNEEIYIKDGEKVILNKSSKALHILQNVRDESHRFATSHNQKLRKKELAFTELEKIKGIGEKSSVKLIKTYKNIKTIAKQNPEELYKTCNIKMDAAENLINYLNKNSNKK